MWNKRKTYLTAALIFIASQILFLINIQYPVTPNFDEFHYIPSAKQFLDLDVKQNWEHPPLGKLLMAIGISVFGDQPIGWRYMSTLFGSLTLVGVYFLGLILFSSQEAAIWITLLTVVNHLLYVQARIGMLDTFMFGFLIWGLVTFCATYFKRLPKKTATYLLRATGLFFGLSIACKWFSIVPLWICFALVVKVRLLQNWKTRFQNEQETDWYHPSLWEEISWGELILSFVIIPLLSYAVTFTPFLFMKNNHFTILDFFSFQTRMYDDQLRVVTNHPYMSTWLDWPTLRRPMWYAYDMEKDNSGVRGIILLGNPLMMWSGLIAVFYCFWDWIKSRDKTAFTIFLFYSAFYFCWMVIPRKIEFYYYYYPSGMMLSFALAYLFFNPNSPTPKENRWTKWVFLGASAAMFIYFFPILSAMKISTDSFRQWMWFRSWI